ncbi:MAG: hypothetical protein NT099_01250, partial [Candidatus Saganbacteria bacterium]|nr:hypothetical protein [Candidatus Saganbacteria bacterium]
METVDGLIKKTMLDNTEEFGTLELSFASHWNQTRSNTLYAHADQLGSLQEDPDFISAEVRSGLLTVRQTLGNELSAESIKELKTKKETEIVPAFRQVEEMSHQLFLVYGWIETAEYNLEGKPELVELQPKLNEGRCDISGGPACTVPGSTPLFNELEASLKKLSEVDLVQKHLKALQEMLEGIQDPKAQALLAKIKGGTFSFADYAGLVSLLKEKGLSDQAKKDAGLALEFLRVTGNVALRRAKCNEKGAARKFVEDNLRKEYSAALFLLDYFDKLPSVKSMPTAKKRMLRQIVLQVLLEYAKGVKKDKKGKLTLADLPAVIKKAESFLKRAGTAADQTIPACDSDPKTEHSICEIHYLLNKKGEQGVETESTEKIKALLGTEISEDYDNFIAWGYSNNDAYKSENDGLSLAADMIYVPMRFYNDSVSAEEQISVEEVLMVLGQMAQDPTILGFESAVLKGGVNLIFRVSEEDNAAKAEFSSELTRQVLQRLVLRKGLSLDQSMVISPTQIMEGKRQHMEAQTSPVFNTFKQLFEWSALGGYEGFYGLGSGVAKDANTGIPLGVDTPLSMLYGMGSIILVYLNQIGESALAKKVQDYINDPVKNPLSPKDFIDLLVALRKSSAHQDAIEETAKILAASSQAALEFPNPVETVFQVTTNELQPYILVPPENFEGNGLDALSFRDRMDTKLPQHQGYVAKDIEVKDFVTRYRIGLLNMSLVGNAQAPDLALFQSQGWSTNEIPWFAMQAYVKKYGGVSVFRYRDGLEPSFTAPQKSLLDQVLASRAFLGDRKAVLHALLQKVMAGNLALSPEEEQKLPELLSAVEAGLKAVSGEKALNGESAALLLILQKALSNKGLVEVAEFQYRFGAPVLTGEQRAVLQSLLKNPLHLTAKDQALLRKIVNDEQRFYADEVDDQYLKGFFDRLSAEGAGLPWDQKVRFDNALLALRSDFSRDRMNYKPGLNANEQRVLSELAVLMKDNNLVIEDYSLDGIDPKATFKENKARIPQEMLKAIKNPADRERFIALYIQAIPMLKQLAQEVALTVPKMEQTDYSRYDLSFTDPIRSLSDIKKLLNHGFVKGMLEAANPPSAADAKMFQMQGKESMGLLLYLLAKDEEVCTAVTGGRPECKDGKILEAYSADLARLNAIEAEIQAHVTTVSGGLLGNISGAYDQVVALSEDMTYETEYKKIITVTDDQGRPKETVSEPEKKPAAGLGAILKLLNKLIDDTKCTDDQKKIFNCDAQRDGYKSDRSFYQFIGNGMSQIDGFVKGFKESGITMLVGLEGFETNLTVLVDGFVRTELSGVVQFPFVVPKDMKAIIQAVQDSLNLVKGVAGKEKEARKLEYALTFLKACQQVFEQIPLLKAERESLITVTEERAATRKKVVDINTYITGDSFGERETSALLRLTGLDDQGVVQQELASFIDEEHNRVYDLNGMPMPQTAVEILKDYCIKNKGQVLMTARVTPGSHDWKVKMALRAVLDMVPQVTKIDYVNFGMNFLFTTSAASHGFIDPFVLTTAAAEGYAPDLLVGKEQWEAKTAIMRNPVTYLISKTAATVGMMSETNQPYPMTHEAYMLLTEFDEDPDFLGNRLKDNVATDPTAGSFLHEFNATAVTYLGSFVEKKMKLAIDNDPLIRKAVMELNSNNQFYFLRFDAEGRLTAESMQEVKGLVAALAADGVEFEVWDAVSARTRFEVMAKEKKWTPEQVDRMVTFCKLVEDIFKVIGKKNELAGLFTPNSSPSTYLDLLEVTRVGMGLAKKPERLPGTVVSAPAQGEQEFAVYGELSATDKLMMDKYIEDIIPAGQGVMHWVDEYLKKAEKNPAMAFGSALYGFAKGYARTVKDLRFMMPKNIAMGFVSFWKGVFFTIDNLIAGHYQEIRQRVAQISEELGKTSGSFLTYELAGIIFALDFLEKLKKGEVPEAVGSSFIIYQFVKGSIQGMEGAVINTANLLIPRLSNIFNLGWNIAAKASGGRISPILYRSGWGTLQGFGNPEVQMGLGQKITYYVFGFGWLIDVVAEAAGGFQWTRAAASNLKWSLGGGALLVGVDEMGRQMTAVNPAERSALADGNLRGTLNNGWLGKSAGAKLWLTKGAVLFGSIPGGTVRVGVNFLGRFNPGAVGRAFDRGEVSLENSGLADFYAGLTDAEKTELVQEGVEIRSEGILINGKPLSQWQTMFFMWSKRPNKEFRLTFSRLKTGQSIFLLERTAKGVLEVGSDGIIGNEAEVDLTSDPNETINLEYLEAEYTRVKGDLQWIKNQIKQLKAERSAEPDKAKQAELTKKIRQLRLGKLKVQKSAKSLSRALASISEIPVNGAFMLKVTEALFE